MRPGSHYSYSKTTDPEQHTMHTPCIFLSFLCRSPSLSDGLSKSFRHVVTVLNGLPHTDVQKYHLSARTVHKNILEYMISLDHLNRPMRLTSQVSVISGLKSSTNLASQDQLISYRSETQDQIYLALAPPSHSMDCKFLAFTFGSVFK